jgi:hypothetical protein
MPANTEHLKSMLQDIINDRSEAAHDSLHDYFIAKSREVAGLPNPDDETINEPDELDSVTDDDE